MGDGDNSSVAATRLEVGLIAGVGRIHDRLGRAKCGNRSAPVVATSTSVATAGRPVMDFTSHLCIMGAHLNDLIHANLFHKLLVEFCMFFEHCRTLSFDGIRKTEISLMSYCVLIALKPKFSLILT